MFGVDGPVPAMSSFDSRQPHDNSVIPASERGPILVSAAQRRLKSANSHPASVTLSAQTGHVMFCSSLRLCAISSRSAGSRWRNAHP